MKKLLILLVVAIAGLFAWTTASTPGKPSKLIVSGPFEFHGTDLSKDGSVFSRLGVTQSLTGLLPDGSIEPVLAKDWTQNEEGTLWKFEIRDGVKFHNGELLTAKDVVVSLIHARTKPGIIKNVPIKSISANDMTVTVELESAYRPLLSTLAHFTLGVVSADSFNKEGNITVLNGTGPFSIASMVAPHKLTLNKFEQYWGTSASIDLVEYQAGHRSESRALQVQSGQADIAYSIDAISKKSLSGDDGAKVESVNLPRTILVKVNNSHPFLENVRARQAMSLALDRSGIANSVLFAPGSEAYQLFNTNQSAWHLDNLVNKQDIEKAKSLLAGLGWAMNGEGVLEKDGQTFSINLITYANRPELPMVATALQNQLAKVGIQVNVSIENSSAIPSGHHDGSLNLAIIARNFGMAGTPLPLIYSDFSRPEGSDWGHMNWSNAQLSDNLDKLISTSYEDVNHKYEQDTARILAENLPVIPVAYSTQHTAVNSKLSGLILDPFELNYRLEDLKFND
ncbi:ABC transporter substrate-binding protein [Vibrio parahaemolyticus]|uniref:ABC transporter substrate-binding protein n=1 Tax=Vibrio parahaemolyticus TaxID=670 RepID=UPI00111F9F9B|nr:ABC transporter substrate-binding protein [Vibrio parahaemolyticus]EGR3114622.1 ABC transporter substrate-binding protein [Vibrio parahaemolyticus]EJG1643153.1 ABC transporter substrate-binding protein [Vibrio parahaemolyticus]ELP2671337.1 ABC transporter substrate-binding protein [Vibrio parahaemolyticus]MBC8656074.1 ABC transporter substrate-binding protein [Vibrio parahaemolyticus]MBM5023723.1 ABC transporter substrate-binding protein [Vibrio parahaemolyticus]